MLELGTLADGEPRVVLGRLGWMFLCNRATIYQLTGRLRLLERQLGEYEEAIQARWARFKQLQIPYVFTPVPMKEIVYWELLPDGLEITASELPLDQLLELFRTDPNVEIMDLRPILCRAKLSADVYFRTDTHLSAIGGHCVYDALVRHPHCAALGIAAKPIEEFPFKVMGGLREPLAEKEPAILVGNRLLTGDRAETSEHSEIAVLIDAARLGYELAPPPQIPPAYELSARRKTRIFERLDAEDLPSAMIVGDSFMWRVVPYLMSHFRRIVCLWIPNPPFSAIEAEQPDIVFQLIAERFLIRSPLMPDWESDPHPPAAFEPGVDAPVEIGSVPIDPSAEADL